MCESCNCHCGQGYDVDYCSVILTNLCDLGRNYNPENSHVIRALIRRFYKAKVSNSPEVVIWGTGTSRREFQFVDDMAKAPFLSCS
jgi:GDP-L-fucose synthase